jgi:head-tail adaptor
MARITANDLRDRVSLEEREEVDDGYGNTWHVGGAESCATLASCHSRVARSIAARPEEVQPALIIVRYDAETSTITADWRLIETRAVPNRWHDTGGSD